MTGFKDGASSDDPLGADDDRDDQDAGVGEDPLGADPEPSSDAGPATRSATSSTLPWIHSRNSITDGRPATVQLHLQESTVDEQRDAKREVESLLGESVKKADLREAALLVGLGRVEEVADVLREWGYNVE